MVHLKKNKANQFYWLTCVKKGRTFEVIGKSSESYTSKQNCEKAVKLEAGVFNGHLVDVIDHTGKQPMFFDLFLEKDKWRKGNKIKGTKENFDYSWPEIQFVQKLKGERK